MNTGTKTHSYTHLRLWIPTFPSFFLLTAWLKHSFLYQVTWPLEYGKICRVCTQTHIHTHTHTVADRGGYPKEGVGHQNYKVGQHECHDDEEQLNCSVYTHPQTYAMYSCAHVNTQSIDTKTWLLIWTSDWEKITSFLRLTVKKMAVYLL